MLASGLETRNVRFQMTSIGFALTIYGVALDATFWT